MVCCFRVLVAITAEFYQGDNEPHVMESPHLEFLVFSDFFVDEDFFYEECYMGFEYIADLNDGLLEFGYLGSYFLLFFLRIIV